jgi:hypothetical protein
MKLDRARRHFAAMEDVTKAFLASQPYGVETRQDSTSHKLLYVVAKASEPPLEVSLIAGDVLHNLRSALDHLAWQLVQAAGGTPTKDTSFPIFDSSSKYTSGAAQKLKGMSKAAITAIDALKPYRGGDDLLWQLHRLENVDKHRVLIAVGSAFNSVNIGPVLGRSMEKWWKEKGFDLPKVDLFLKPADRLFPLKPGMELFVDAPNAEPNSDVQFRVDVAFGETDIVNGAALIDTLQAMVSRVEQLLAQFAPML